jgi:hypothetical protein
MVVQNFGCVKNGRQRVVEREERLLRLNTWLKNLLSAVPLAYCKLAALRDHILVEFASKQRH